MKLDKEGSVKISSEIIMGDHFQFDSVFIKKIKLNLKKTKTGSNQLVLVRFGFLNKNRFKAVWLGFFRFGFGSFQFFLFQIFKIKTEPVTFFKILINFFSRFNFSVIFLFTQFLMIF